MTSPNLDRLVAIGSLIHEPPIRREFEGLLESGTDRLRDATNKANSVTSRFDLAYNAAHAFALAALRWHGYRPPKTARYIVFQTLAHTLGTPASTWRLLATCHERRNLIEYEGLAQIDETLLENLLEAAQGLRDAVSNLSPPTETAAP